MMAGTSSVGSFVLVAVAGMMRVVVLDVLLLIIVITIFLVDIMP